MEDNNKNYYYFFKIIAFPETACGHLHVVYSSIGIALKETKI